MNPDPEEQESNFLVRLAKKEREIEELKREKNPIYHNWHEEGGGLIVPTGYGFALYEVPQFGGEPVFYDHFKTLDEAKKAADQWT